MTKSLRHSEKWFHVGLWLVALVFAGFLIGLGSVVIRNLPRVEHQFSSDEFMDRPAASMVRSALRAADERAHVAADALEQARLKHQVAQANVASARDSLTSWLSTRRATDRPDQDAEVLTRTRALDELKAAERKALAAMETQQQVLLDAQQARTTNERRLADMEATAQTRLATAQRHQELRVFGYRLALTLPLLVVAGLLVRRHRKSVYWPFVWGFVIFALFTFFVELVPYLPSYGGYVRYLVGIVVTGLVGRQAILALQGYLERQRLAEELPDVQRREELSYDSALARLDKGICPGCERPVDLKDPAIDFCPHCGICLYARCTKCEVRKNAFAKFCHSCGTASAGRKT
jgi:predicted RNA-binding Zn-ribbon protein involved in translation (DUF1610 family)